MRIICFAKQVPNPEIPNSVRIEGNKAVPAAGVPPVINGFDENAIEAALRIKAKNQATVTVISLGSSHLMEVMKKPLSMGSDELILLQDPAFDEGDAYSIAYALALAVKKAGQFDLILCGRQASDTDRGQVGTAVAQILGLPVITLAKVVEVTETTVQVERVLSDGTEKVEAPLPALVTVSNELGEPRYPTLRGIMAAGRKTPTIWKAVDIGAEPAKLGAQGRLVRETKMFVPEKAKQIEWVTGETPADAGKNLALKLRQAKLI